MKEQGGEEDVGEALAVARVQPLPTRRGPPPLTVYSREDLKKLPDPVWLIEGIVQAERTFALYGEPGVGKSFVILDFALCISTGTPWLGRMPVIQGPVLYFSPEGTTGLKLRVEGWELVHKVEAKDFFVVADAPHLLSPADQQRIAEAVRAFERHPVLVVIDTLARHMVGGKENAQEDMSRAVEALEPIRKQFGTTIAFVHHSAKGSEEMRGSSTLPGAIDTQIYVKSLGKDDIELQCKKQKDGEEFRKIRLTRTQVTLPRSAPTTTCVITESASTSADAFHISGLKSQLVPEPRKARKLDEHQKNILAAFKSLAGATSSPLSRSNIEKASGVPPGSFGRVIDSLISAGVVQEAGHGQYALTVAGQDTVRDTPKPNETDQ